MEKHTRLGRNAPCWCGSGKKYKDCHLRRDEDEQVGLALRKGLSQRLEEYAIQARFKRDLRDALSFFFGPDRSPDDEEEEDRLFALKRGMDFFIHDYPLSDGRRLIERFHKEQARQLSPAERSLLESWLDSRPAVYEVIAVERGSEVLLRDLVTLLELKVQDKDLSQQVDRWQVVWTRLFPQGDHFESSGIGLYIPTRFRDWVRSYANELWQAYRVRHENESYESFLHASTQLLNQFLLNEVQPSVDLPPALVTREGDPVEACEAEFEVLDLALVQAGLRSGVEFQETSAPDAEEKDWNWNEAGESLELLAAHGPEFKQEGHTEAETGSKHVLGQIHLTGSTLYLRTYSERRLKAGKELLASRLGSALQHLGDRIEPLEQALAELESFGEDQQSEIEIDEELEALQAETIARDRKAWIDRPVPALGEQTPRDAVKSLGGRIRVIRLIKQFENWESARARQGEIPYSWDEVKHALGLQDHEFVQESAIEELVFDELATIELAAYGDNPERAVQKWREFRQTYRIRDASDLDFSDVWDLYEACEEALDAVLDRLAATGDRPAAFELTQELADFSPHTADVWRAETALLRVESGEAEEGERILRELAERNPDNADIVLALARVQRHALNQPEEAIATLQHALAEMGDDLDYDDLYTALHETFFDLGQFERAKELWHSENDSLPEEEREYTPLIEVLLAQNELDRARELLPRVETEVTRLFWIGMVEAHAGNLSAARVAWADRLDIRGAGSDLLLVPWQELQLRLHDPNAVLSRRVSRSPGHGCLFNLALAHALNADLRKADKFVRRAMAALDKSVRPIERAEHVTPVRRLARDIGLSPETLSAIGL